MIEYLYDCIKGISGEDIDVVAEITDADGKDIESGCSLLLIDKDYTILHIYDGVYADGAWTFTIPADITYYMDGRYWYRIKFKDDSLSFAAPLYIGR